MAEDADVDFDLARCCSDMSTDSYSDHGGDIYLTMCRSIVAHDNQIMATHTIADRSMPFSDVRESKTSLPVVGSF